MFDYRIEKCERTNWCVDCDDEICIHAGDLYADCPKWRCPFNDDCHRCEFIKELYATTHSAEEFMRVFNKREEKERKV